MPHTDDFPFHIPIDLTPGPEWTMGTLSDPVNWGMGVFGVDRLRSIVPGGGVTVGVIDTGCDADHVALKGQVISRRDFTGSSRGWRDVNGHGTHCAATIAGLNPRIGVNPEAKLVIGKGLGDNGSGSTSGIAAAMRWCVGQGATILSMSLGSSGADSETKAAAVELAGQGIWIVAAAGNSGGNTPDVDFPGRYPETFSVAALDAALRVASFSSAGAKINGSGPGVDIWSAKPGGGYQSMSGTSMATPFIAGLLSLLRSGMIERKMPIPKMPELQTMIAARSMDVGAVGVDRRTGPGAVWPMLLAMMLEPDPPKVAA